MLTDMALRHAKGREKQYKLSDSQGLYILVKPNGSRLWRLKYRFNGKEKSLALGAYPEVGLIQARSLRDAARAELRDNKDPSITRRQRRAASDNRRFLRALSLAWIDHNTSLWTERHKKAVHNSLEEFIFPALGHLPAEDITPPMILDELRRVERNVSPDKAKRIRQRVSAVYSYGIACGLVSFDPADQLKGALRRSPKGRQPAITNLAELREMLREVEAFPSHPVVKLAFRFLALTACRSAEVRGMNWNELSGNKWSIPAARMKMNRDHIVPLSTQALDILEAVKPFSSHLKLVFPSPRWAHKPFSDSTLSIMLRRLGYEGRHVPHGFRSSFSSIMNEHSPDDRAIIDMMLAHAPKNDVEGAYNRASHLQRRAELAQEWADLLLKGLPSAQALIQPSCVDTTS